MDGRGAGSVVDMTAASRKSAEGHLTREGSPERRTGPLGWVRTVLAAVLALCAGLAAVVALLTTWVDDTIMDRGGFAALSEQLLSDQQLRDELETTALETTSEAVQDIDTGGVPLGGLMKDYADRAAQDVLGGYLDSDLYSQDVREVLEGTYDANVAAAAGPDGAPEDLQLEIAPVIDGLTTAVSDRLPMGLEIDLGSMDLFGSSDGMLTVPDSATGPVLDLIAAIAQQAPYWWAGAVAAVVLALLIARHREWVLVGAGLGLLGGVIAAGAAMQSFAEDLLASPELEGVARAVLERLMAVLGTGLEEHLAPWIWAGAILTLAGLVLCVVRLTWRAGADGDAADGSLADLSRRSGRRVIEG